MVCSFFCLTFELNTIPNDCDNCYELKLQTFLYGCAKLFLSMTFVLIQIYYPELFPAQVRSTGLGLTISCGVASTFLIPPLIALCQSWHLSEMTVFGVLGVLASACFLFLEETRDRGLLTRISELETQSRFSGLGWIYY